jgi:hypothetical protein
MTQSLTVDEEDESQIASLLKDKGYSVSGKIAYDASAHGPIGAAIGEVAIKAGGSKNAASGNGESSKKDTFMEKFKTHYVGGRPPADGSDSDSGFSAWAESVCFC